MFLLGIVIGCLTITKQGDVYGRKPIYLLGLIMQLVIVLALIISKNYWIDTGFLVVLGMSMTARYYVGYTYNIEMQP